MKRLGIKDLAQDLTGSPKRVFLALMLCLCAAGPLFLLARPAFAVCESCFCVSAAHASIRAEVQMQHQRTQVYIAQQMQIHREQWIIPWFFKQHILAAMMHMAENLTGASMHQMMILGSFFDAKEEMERLRGFQEAKARAYKEYAPSVSFCEFGTLVRSLAEGQRTAEVNALVMSQRQEQRGRNITAMSTAEGKGGDVSARVKQFIERFCDIRENNTGLAAVCFQDGVADPSSALFATRDKDVDYMRDVDSPSNLMIDFTYTNNPLVSGTNDFGDNQVDNQLDAMTLSTNLFGNTPLNFISKTMFEAANGTENRPNYLDIRGILAKRSVAENSFNAIVGMKARAGGKENPDEIKKTAGYMKVIYKELGVDQSADLAALMTDQPSYYAQMEILTKKLYERPQFYTNLYDKPANIDRKEVAMRAIGLMQHMDMFKSQLRAEATLSVILETGLVEEEQELNNRIRAMKVEGRQRTAP
jgi:hypothetical protein